MKLIIDIDENVRITITRMGLLRIPDEMKKKVDKAIQSGRPLDNVLNKIRAKLHETAEMHDDGDCYLRDEWIDEYFDEYKTEIESQKGANE